MGTINRSSKVGDRKKHVAAKRNSYPQPLGLDRATAYVQLQLMNVVCIGKVQIDNIDIFSLVLTYRKLRINTTQSAEACHCQLITFYSQCCLAAAL